MTHRSAIAIAVALATLPHVALAQQPDWTKRQPLPSPNGTYAVGTLTMRLEDWSRPTSHRLVTRPLVVQVWYPSSSTGLKQPKCHH